MEVETERPMMFNEEDFPLIKPVVCACSNTQEHTEEHVECRCTGWSRFNSQLYAPHSQKGCFPKNLLDEQDFHHCRYCGKVRVLSADYLVTCEVCGKLFKGPRPYFPIDYACEACE